MDHEARSNKPSSIQRGLARLDAIEDGSNEIVSYFTINPDYTVEMEGYVEEVYSWVEIPDHLWGQARMLEHIQGYPMPSDIGFAKRK